MHCLVDHTTTLDEFNLLYHLDTTEKRGRKGRHAQLVIPPPLRHEVLVNAHDDLAGGHFACIKRTRNYGTDSIGRGCIKMWNIGFVRA